MAYENRLLDIQGDLSRMYICSWDAQDDVIDLFGPVIE
jgi:hypothetical protein